MKLTRIALLGIVLALFAAGCSDEGNVFSLEVGDCFLSLEAEEVSDVSIVDCSEPHELEVFAVWNVGDTLPSEEAMAEGCVDRFENAIGIAYSDSVIFSAPITPTSESFSQGDREVICHTAELDAGGDIITVTGSSLNSRR
jgi:hypothetical protein